jgi:phosphatidate phosphatase APP1
MLRDWGINEQTVLVPGHRRHKLGHIRQILDCYPDLPFLLIGDSGQEDPEIYKDVIAEYPGRINAAYIRNVSPSPLRRASIEALTEQVRAEGSSLILADDTLAAARHAHEHGWIADEAFQAMKAEAAGRGADGVATIVVDGDR